MALRRRDVERLIREAAPEIGDSFVAVMMRVPANADLGDLTDAIRAADPDGAWAAVDMSEADFNDFREGERRAFGAGGTAEAAEHGWKINLFAERALADENRRVGRFITSTIDETRDMIRDRIRRGIADGENPRRVALDIVGRRKIGTHTRTGGMIGLTPGQEEWVLQARSELRREALDLADQNALLRNYLQRRARDRRFDGTVRRALREGRAVPAEIRDKMIAAYRSRLLRYRGETIGRTEAMSAVNAGRSEAIDQAVEDPNNPIQAQEVRRTWIAARDDRVRDSHIAMSGQVVGHGEPFVSPTGARLMYPGDSSLGAGPAEIVNCRCTFVTTLR